MSDIVIYENGNIELKATVENETVWLTQKQIAELFDVQRPAITKHLSNIFKSNELDENVVCSILEHTTKHGAIQDKKQSQKTKIYNLDAIISVGYRVNSKKATQFRIWANKVLKEYLIKGYALNKDKLKQQKLQELEQTIQLIKQSLQNNAIGTDEAKGFVEIVSNYAKSWALLQGYDDQSLEEITQTKESKFILDYNEAKAAIAELKSTLIAKGEATELFGQEKAGELKGNLRNIYQSFAGEDLLPSVEAKAANLLYYIIKGHPFNDGNKRIGAYLFVLFLHKNGILYKPNGETKINDNALASIALLVAQSSPSQKEIIIKLVMNMLYEGDI
ncbi:virulence protein RhuM/Fic/DOC family protein [Francisella tularensis subsp. novicida]|uniref:virulence protein RhuM/Fic/DOC family protein n=1 Tax=Francisella tularensis TaxID=263 RepID=UPI000501F2E3|nr:virulence protein RhuM/Fic/DOC family protein [Francisella tularensis]AJJ46675.1 death-on-curing family protein [Francisella tularensis subsp. novicida]APC99188.1 death-on-curing family protein [Francisella tularensis subsp. novicida]KFJ68447.1 death-on-curing family protein [Francisella tularensis subsp. novicida]MBK2344904.1 virulence protein RhuM/Fic/DOC family protein [Francisella tularensis subsp. novicida]MBK2350258.1 virulence protein RhuM/Fic/DOC family protein [Francisella tularens